MPPPAGCPCGTRSSSLPFAIYATTTTWGGCVPWLVSNAALFVDVVVASNEYVPFPVIALLRLTSTHVPTVTAPTEATGLPEMAGLLPQTTMLSVQSFETRYQSPPRALASSTYSRSLTEVGGPLSPFRVNLMSDRYSAGGSNLSFMVGAVA